MMVVLDRCLLLVYFGSEVSYRDGDVEMTNGERREVGVEVRRGKKRREMAVMFHFFYG